MKNREIEPSTFNQKNYIIREVNYSYLYKIAEFIVKENHKHHVGNLEEMKREEVKMSIMKN